MKKIKEGFINEEIVRRYPGSDNGGNNIVDKGNVVAEELGDLDANMSGWGGCLGYQDKFCEGQDKVTFANKGRRNRDEEE